MAPRLLALVAAVAMVVGSIALRARLDDDGDGGGRGGGGGDGGRPRLVCSTEVAAACDAVSDDAEVTVEPAGATLDRLVALEGRDPGLDGWLVAGPWPEMVDLLRQQAQRDAFFEDEPRLLARSPLVIAIWPDRADALRNGPCKPNVTWKCLGDVAGKPWSDVGAVFPGAVRPGYADGRRQAVGLGALATAATSFFGTTGFGQFELDDPAFGGWISRLQMATPHPDGTSPLTRMLQTRRGEYDAVGTVEAEAAPLLSSAADKPVLIYPEPVATVDVVLGTAPAAGGDGAARLAGRLTDALHAGGWRVTNRPLPEGVSGPQLRPESNMPSAGVLLALREEVVSR